MNSSIILTHFPLQRFQFGLINWVSLQNEYMADQIVNIEKNGNRFDFWIVRVCSGLARLLCIRWISLRFKIINPYLIATYDVLDKRVFILLNYNEPNEDASHAQNIHQNQGIDSLETSSFLSNTDMSIFEHHLFYIRKLKRSNSFLERGIFSTMS